MKIMQFAQESDLSAQRFFEEMATRTENPGVSRIFHMLAEEEGALLGRHQARTGRDAEYATKALNRGVNIFERFRHQEDHLAVPDDVAAYRLALDAEREVLQQYRQAAETEKNPAAKKVLGEIVAEEQQMVEELENLYDFANAPNHFLAWGEFSNLGEFHNFGRDIA